MNTRHSLISVMIAVMLGTTQAGMLSAGEAEVDAGARAAKEVAALEAAAAAAPDDAEAQVELSRAYATVGRAEDAFKAIEKAVELSPDNLAYHSARIPLANWAGKTEAAAESAGLFSR